MLNANFGYQMQMTVDLTVEMLPVEKSSIRDNGLEAPLMIEWGVSGLNECQSSVMLSVALNFWETRFWQLVLFSSRYPRVLLRGIAMLDDGLVVI